MQALKVLVAMLTILIVIAMTIIAYGMYRKSDDPAFKFFELGGDSTAPHETQPSALSYPTGRMKSGAPTPTAFGETMLSLPMGCNISTVSGDGFRIFFKVGPAEPKCERVIVMDAGNGVLLGTIKVSH
jgi:hypothetical protein